MTRRRKLLLAALITIPLAGALALPVVHWPLIGWWRGEPFWQGMPSSFYSARVRAGHYDSLIHKWLDDSPAAQWVRAHFGDRTSDFFWRPVPPFGLEGPGRAALPVLLALLSDPDRRVRNWAIGGIESLGPDAVLALPDLSRRLGDSDPEARYDAAYLLGRIGAPSRPALPALCELLRDQARHGNGETVAEAAAEALRQIDPIAWEAAGRP
jgi:hypothetical protein